MDSKANATRKMIFKAAIKLLTDGNIQSLTLEAAAKEAGVSKGGLLYHFANKEELLQELALHIFDDFSEMFYRFANDDSIEKGKWCRAYIRASDYDLKNNGLLDISLMSAALTSSAFVTTMSQSCQQMFEKMLDDGLDATTASIIRLTIDGFYYGLHYNIPPLQDAVREEVIGRLMKMTE
ncbi:MULTISPECIES: TetR/AcrR family transcriptional regulator [unclassified Paenibacillus]|uniref:TetR/AcrR family transcriptional regulator n=1 Tax=unclassified Paenibacillus TaxID=185978 RepID=UPI0036D27630